MADESKPQPQAASTEGSGEAAQPQAPQPPVKQIKSEMEKLQKPEKHEQKEFKVEGKIEHKESLVKEHKPEKFEQKEKVEVKEFKVEGKIEHKESLIKEHKREKFEQPEKDLAAEVPQGPGPVIDPAAVHDRLSRIESAVAELRHFIKPEDRPDLSKGALTNETDQKNAQ